MAIQIDSSASPLLSGTPGATHTLSSTLVGVVTYLWEIVSQPPGTTDTLSSASAATPTLIANKEGSYLIRLTATNGAGTTQETALLVNPSITSGLRVPAYAEIIEAGATGWDQGAGNILRSLDLYREQAGVIACVVRNGSVSAGRLVTVAMDPSDVLDEQSAVQVLSSKPGVRSLPSAFSVPDDGFNIHAPLVGIAIGGPDGSSSVSAGSVVLVRISGVYSGAGVTYSGANGDYPFVFPDGANGLTDALPNAEEESRCIGKVVRWSGGSVGSGTADVMVYGDRVPRSHSIQFGSDGSALATTLRYLPPGSGAATTDYVGQFMAIPGNGPVILSRMRVYTPTTTTVTTKIEVVYANTGPTGLTGEQELLSGVKAVNFSTWIPIDKDEPIGVSVRHPSGTGPLWLSVTLELLEL
jgi:hypothetical protein